MGLFDRKFCDICGQKIGLLGNRKLEDGNMCKDCAAKLSPWFSERRHSTLAEIRDQLAYREENKQRVARFHTTKTLGMNTKILLDEDAGKFMVTSARNLADANPDVLDYADVTGCVLDIDENRTEIKRKGPDGKEYSFNPPRYQYRYDFYINIHVNNPYFDDIRFKLNSSSVDGNSRAEYDQYRAMGEEIKHALLDVRQTVREEINAANAPKQAVTCPWCGATTVPDASGCCEYCGGAVRP